MQRCWLTAGIVVAIFVAIGASGRLTTNRAAEQRITQDATGQAQAKPGNADESSFLIARRGLNDPLFGKSVILMLPVVDPDGVVGLIVNRPTKITLHELFPKIAAYKEGTAIAYFGGPVDVKTGGVLFRSAKAYKEAFHLTGDLYVSFNSEVIEKVLKKPKDVTNVRLFLGRSQWKNKQLAAEMERGSWFGEKEANSVIFRHDSANVWIELIGALEPGNVAEWNSGDEGGKRQEGSFASLGMTIFYLFADQSGVGVQIAKVTGFR
ncbi:MAG TPA: YqgE/AlgH family protein [Candidatus Acidoferrales bacterium]